MIVIERREAGSLAKALRPLLAAKGVHLAHQAATVAVSAALGFSDPNAMSAAFKRGPLLLLLGDEETARDGHPPAPMPPGKWWVNRTQAAAQFIKLVGLHLNRARRYVEIGPDGTPGTRTVKPSMTATMAAAGFGAATDACAFTASSSGIGAGRRAVIPDEVAFTGEGVLCELRREAAVTSWAVPLAHDPEAAGVRLAAYLAERRQASLSPEDATTAWRAAVAKATFLPPGALGRAEPLGRLLRAFRLDAWLTDAEPERTWPGTDRLRPDVALGEAILQEFAPLLLFRGPGGQVGRFSGTYLSSDSGLGLVVPSGKLVVERVVGVPADFLTANDTDASDAELDAAIRASARGTAGHFRFEGDGSRGTSGTRHHLMEQWEATIQQTVARLSQLSGATFDTSPQPDEWNLMARLAGILETAKLPNGGSLPWRVVFLCPLRRPFSATIVPAGYDLAAALESFGEVIEHEIGGDESDPA